MYSSAEVRAYKNYKAFKRARKSLYDSHISEWTPERVFLFTGWLRLEERARHNLGREPEYHIDRFWLEPLLAPPFNLEA